MPFHLSPLIEADQLIFTSGQLALDDQGAIQGADIGAQTRIALSNLSRTLKRAGLDLSDVVKTTVWITDPAGFADFDAAYAAAFGDHRPARSTVVASLVLPQALVEIEAVAVKTRA